MADKYRFKIKIALIAVGILILGVIIIKNITNIEGPLETAKCISIEDVSDMLIFTGKDADTWTSLLGKTGKDYLTNSDVQKILDTLQVEEKAKEEYVEASPKEFVTKDNWLALYDKILESLDTEKKVSYGDVFILADSSNIDTLSDNEIYTDKGIYTWKNSRLLTDYLYRGCNVILYENEIIYVVKNLETEYELHNVYFVLGDEEGFRIFNDGKYFQYTNRPLEEKISSAIGDIVFSQGEIKQIKIKGDKISGKLLAVKADSLEIEDYGEVPLEEGFKVYKEYGQLEELSINDLLVGYNVTEFIVADGKISAGLIMKDLVVDNIRVLIKNNNYENIFHENAVVTGDSDYTIYYGDKEEKHTANEEVSIDADSELWETGRIKIVPDILSGKITLLSVERATGNPSYRGSIEIVKDDSGLIIINEVSMEEYLYMVVPSEMPESYGIEALKAQAVCARSYAYIHILDNAYSQYGAQVDDSVSYQVYSNQGESALCTQAVKETYGQVLEKDENVIETYYFSTSSGHTTDSEVWVNQNEEDRSYLQPKFIGEEDSDLDLTDETVFYDFITKDIYDAFEGDEPWYRWTTTIPVSTLSNTLNSRVAARYEVNPELILVKNKDGEYESKAISNIGIIKNITVIHRNAGGVLDTVVIEGTKETIKVKTEYNIRYLLAPISTQVTKSDGSVIDSFSLLPSAYCIFEKVYDNKKLTDFKITGGGYGHGVGMSQNGAKIMAAKGYSYDEILKYFYSGVDFESIY
ncbi:SpoIID/LytB domain-containing protein [Konateibacter massiliensis]|uniref:SpoIID/LytB domain-containing protein n=1 Tax=Konateibacter massiliensis TaxID=2002841 RepID=UPI0015D47BD3|nr:SpoIID/LytB domain-containing protein [Konateibacter massiliensis]